MTERPAKIEESINSTPYSESDSQTNWERIDAMTDEEIEAAACSDLDNPPLTEKALSAFKNLKRFRRVPNTLAIRQRLNISQKEFAENFGIPLRTLIELEERRRFPTPTMMTLLRIIEHEPEAVKPTLKKSYRRKE